MYIAKAVLPEAVNECARALLMQSLHKDRLAGCLSDVSALLSIAYYL